MKMKKEFESALEQIEGMSELLKDSTGLLCFTRVEAEKKQLTTEMLGGLVADHNSMVEETLEKNRYVLSALQRLEDLMADRVAADPELAAAGIRMAKLVKEANTRSKVLAVVAFPL